LYIILIIIYLTINKEIQPNPKGKPVNKSCNKPINITEDHVIKSGLWTIQNITVIIPNKGIILLIPYGKMGSTVSIVKNALIKIGITDNKLENIILKIFITL